MATDQYALSLRLNSLWLKALKEIHLFTKQHNQKQYQLNRVSRYNKKFYLFKS